MNTFNYFIIGILLLSTQALAIRPIATKLERISVDTFRFTMDQPVHVWEDFLLVTIIGVNWSYVLSHICCIVVLIS
jgi:hypothetical protein